MIFLMIMATIIGYSAYKNMWIGLISVFVVIIPSVYSLIPLIVEQRKLKSFRKNRLTESIFTDRKEDLEDIIRILNSIIINTKFIQNNRYRSMSSLFWCGYKYRISILQEGHCTYGKTITRIISHLTKFHIHLSTFLCTTSIISIF